MDSKDKKETILKKLQSTTDEQLIEEVYDILYSNEEIKSIPVANFSEELQNKISRALDDYKSGRYITHEQMKQKVAKWLTS